MNFILLHFNPTTMQFPSSCPFFYSCPKRSSGNHPQVQNMITIVATFALAMKLLVHSFSADVDARGGLEVYSY